MVDKHEINRPEPLMPPSNGPIGNDSAEVRGNVALHARAPASPATTAQKLMDELQRRLRDVEVMVAAITNLDEAVRILDNKDEDMPGLPSVTLAWPGTARAGGVTVNMNAATFNPNHAQHVLIPLLNALHADMQERLRGAAQSLQRIGEIVRPYDAGPRMTDETRQSGAF